MYSASSAFNTAIHAPGRTLRSRLAIASGDTLDDSFISSMELKRAVVPDSGLLLGTAIAQQMTITLLDPAASYAPEDFTGIELTPSIGIEVAGGSFEYVPMGLFIADQPKRSESTLTIVAYDRMVRAEKPYVSALAYPSTMGAVLAEAASQCGLTVAAGTILNSGLAVPAAITGVTCRQIFGWAAEVAVGFARITRDGKLQIVRLAAGSSAESLTPANYFPPMAVADEAWWADGLVVAATPENVGITYGTATRPWAIIGNPFLAANPVTEIMAIVSALAGVQLWPFAVDWQGNPALDPGDKITVKDYKTGTVRTALAGVETLRYSGGLRSTLSLPAPSAQQQATDARMSLDQLISFKADTANITEIIAQQIRAGKRVVVGKDDGARSEIYLDNGVPRYDMYDPSNVKRSSWGYDGMKFYDLLGVVTSLMGTTAQSQTITVGPGKMFPTPQAAYDSLPKTIQHSVTINCDPGVYGSLNMRGSEGGGLLAIYGVGATLDSISLGGMSVFMTYISGFTVKGTSGSAVYVYGSEGVMLDSLTITTAASQNGIEVVTSTAKIYNGAISNRLVGIYVAEGGVAMIGNVAGTGNSVGIEAAAGLWYDLGANTITGTTPRVRWTGGIEASKVWQGATRIPANADLFSYTTEGLYYCPLSADAATIANYPGFIGAVNPNAVAFSLLVEKHAGVKLTLTEYLINGKAKTYTINYYSGNWESSWRQVWDSGTSVAVNPVRYSNPLDANTVLDPFSLCTTNIPTWMGSFAYIITLFYNGVSATNNRAQIAFTYSGGSSIATRNYINGTGWTSWSSGVPYDQAATGVSGITVGNGTLVARKSINGGICHVEISFTLGSTSSVSGDVAFTMPHAAKTSQTLGAVATIYQSGARKGAAGLINSTAGYVRALTVSGSYVGMASLSASVPAAWAAGDVITFNASYEMA